MKTNDERYVATSTAAHVATYRVTSDTERRLVWLDDVAPGGSDGPLSPREALELGQVLTSAALTAVLGPQARRNCRCCDR